MRQIVILLLCFAFIKSGHCAVKLEGLLKFDAFLASGAINKLRSETNEFSIYIGEADQWLFEVDASKNNTDIMYLGSDGADIYFARFQSSDFDNSNRIIGETDIKDKANVAYVSKGSYPLQPYDESKRVNILWLAYGAEKFIRENESNTMPLPWLSARWTPLAYGFRYEILRDDNNELNRMQFLRSTEHDLETEQEELERNELDYIESIEMQNFRIKHLKRRIEQWHDGYLGGDLVVSSRISINNKNFPEEYTLKVYDPVWGDNIKYKYHVLVTNVSENVALKSFKPPVIGPLAAEDSRYRIKNSVKAVNSIVYGLTSSNDWDSLDHIELSDHLNAKIATAFRSNDYGTYKRLILSSVTVLIFVVFPILIYRKFLSISRNANSKQTSN